MTPAVRLALGESPQVVDPKQIQRDVYRGAMWELVRIGRLWPAAAQGVLLVLLLVFAITGMPWPSIIASGILIGVAIWSQRNVTKWAEAHNARVAPSGTPRRKPVSKAQPSRSAKSAKSKRRP